LQRLGFGWSCKLIYDEVDNLDAVYECENYTLWDGCYYAPTTALALKWMRDIKGYYGVVLRGINGFFVPVVSLKSGNHELLSCATYEQAESALLEYMLDRLGEAEVQLNNVD
jgi:hypothetical protein